MDGRDDTGGDRGPRRSERPTRGSEGDISAHASSGDRIVFSESGNGGAWIATDTTVDVTR